MMDDQHIKHPSYCRHCSYQPSPMNMPSMLLHDSMPIVPPISSNSWNPWYMPYMNMPSMPFMSLMPNMLHDSMNTMRQSMLHQKSNVMEIFPGAKENVGNMSKTSQCNANICENYSKRSGLARNVFNKSHKLQEQSPQRRKSVPSEHDLLPDFYEHSHGTEDLCDFHNTLQKASVSEGLSLDVMSKSTDEGYASYQKTSKDFQRHSSSNEKSISKFENYTKSPPMRRKSLPTPHEIVSEQENMISKMTFCPVHVIQSVPAFQKYEHQFQGDTYKKHNNTLNGLNEMLYGLDTSDDDSFVSSLEGNWFIYPL